MKSNIFVIVSMSTLIIAMLLAAMMADGTSLYRLKATRIHVGPGLIELQRIPYIDHPYGIGVVLDAYDNKWKDGKRYGDYQFAVNPRVDPHPGHFFQLFECTNHQKGGIVVLAAVIICVLTACVQFIVIIVGFVAIEKIERVAIFGKVVIGMQVFLILFNFMAVASAAAVYNTSFDCKQFPSGPFGDFAVVSVRLVEYFDFAYGCIFLVFLLSLEFINLACLILSRAHRPTEEDKPLFVETEEEEEQENITPRNENYAAACFTRQPTGKGSMRNPGR